MELCRKDGSSYAGTAAPELDARAQGIARKYGIDVRIADQCATEHNNFSAIRVTVPYVIDTALQTLTEALDSYPSGFLEQLQCGIR